jgi:hypothetical protein
MNKKCCVNKTANSSCHVPNSAELKHELIKDLVHKEENAALAQQSVRDLKIEVATRCLERANQMLGDIADTQYHIDKINALISLAMQLNPGT